MIATKVATPTKEHLFEICDQIAHAEPGNTQQMASLLQEMIVMYYADVLKQVKQSFVSALGAAVVGALFFGFAVWPTRTTGMAGSGMSPARSYP